MAFKPPVLFFAFANEWADARGHLKELKLEKTGVRGALSGAEQAGRCELEIRADATLEEIFEVFRKHDGRVAVFHFAGHAGGEALRLESETGDREIAHAEGLAARLGREKALRLVFLNGCNSAGQVKSLREAGVPAVIATRQAIDDAMARKFAVQLYEELAAGATIREAFERALDFVRTSLENPSEAYDAAARSFQPQRTGAAAPELPWDLETDDRAARWTIPPAPRWTPRRLMIAAALALALLVAAVTGYVWQTSAPEGFEDTVLPPSGQESP